MTKGIPDKFQIEQRLIDICKQIELTETPDVDEESVELLGRALEVLSGRLFSLFVASFENYFKCSGLCFKLLRRCKSPLW